MLKLLIAMFDVICESWSGGVEVHNFTTIMSSANTHKRQLFPKQETIKKLNGMSM